MKTLSISADHTVSLITDALRQAFPGVVFAVRLEEPILDEQDIRGVDVIWVDGPTREKVEDALDSFQGVTWDPRSGLLDGRSHYVVDEKGELVQVYFNVDYIFCDGPIPV